MQTKRSAKVLGQPNSQITKPTVHRDLGKAGCHLLEPETFSPKSLPLVSEREPEFSAALIAAAVTSTNSLPQCLESVRLDRLVSQCLDMTLPEAAFLAKLPGVSARRPQRTPEGFYGSLHQAISECGLWSLFTVAAHAEWHRSIVPAAYNERTGEIYPTEMAEWRADFRAMAPESDGGGDDCVAISRGKRFDLAAACSQCVASRGGAPLHARRRCARPVAKLDSELHWMVM
jgi:hypothetical protein